MYISLIILTPVLIYLWIYLLILVNKNFPSSASTSIELNIIDTKGIVSNIITKDNISADKEKPNSVLKKKKIHVPKFMLELYENNKIGGKAKEKADVVRSLIPTHAGLLHDNEVIEELSDNHLLIFDLPTSNDDEIFIGAELKILTIIDIITDNDIDVKRILKISVYDDSRKRLLHCQQAQIHHLNNTWVSFDVTAPVDELLQTDSKSKFLKIVLTISAYLPDVSNSFKLSLMPIEEDYEHDYPVLLLSYSSTKENHGNKGNKNNVKFANNRKKRSFEDDYEEETNKLWDDEYSNKKIQMKKIKRIRNNCRIKPLYVNFSEIKYDMWIIQPSGYDAYQCQGRCFYPVADHLNPTKHAIVQALLHSVAPARVSRSCCVPTSLDSISILYVDNQGVLTYRYAYKDMVVVECGCR